MYHVLYRSSVAGGLGPGRRAHHDHVRYTDAGKELIGFDTVKLSSAHSGRHAHNQQIQHSVKPVLAQFDLGKCADKMCR